MGGGEGIAGNFHFFETWEWIKKRLSHPVIFKTTSLFIWNDCSGPAATPPNSDLKIFFVVT